MGLSTILNYAVYGIVAVFLAFGAYRGLKNGFNRQTIKFATVLASFTISFLIFRKIFPLFFSLTKGKTVGSFLGGFGINLPENINGILSSINAEAASYILAVPMALIILPLSFAGCFALISGLLWIPGYVLCGTMGFTKKVNTLKTRVIGSVLGGLQGLFIAAVVLVPIAGIVGTASDVIAKVEEKHPDSTNSVTVSNFYDENIAPLESNFILNFIDGKLGFVYDELTNVRINDEGIYMGDIAEGFYEIFVLYGDLGESFDYRNLTEDNKNSISGMIDTLTKDDYFSTISASALNAVFINFSGDKFPLELEGNIKRLVESIFNIYSHENKETIREDLMTTKNVYFIFNDSGALQVMESSGMTEAMFEALLTKDENGNSTVTLICGEFDKNPRFSHISSDLTKLAMEILLKNSGQDGEDVEEKIETVKDSLNDIIKIDKEGKTEEEYKAEVSDKLNETLADEGIALPPEQLGALTDKVIEEFGDKEDEMTDAELAEFMGHYYDAYKKGEFDPGLFPGGIPGADEE